MRNLLSKAIACFDESSAWHHYPFYLDMTFYPNAIFAEFLTMVVLSTARRNISLFSVH